MWSLWACETTTASSERGSKGNWRLGLLGSTRSESNNPQSSKIRLESISNKCAARDLPSRAMERDSQPSYLPTIDRARLCSGNGTRSAGPRNRRSAGQSSLNRPASHAILRLDKARPAFPVLPPLIILPS